jgi:membrane protein implicated in regulation of membrane protease activity
MKGGMLYFGIVTVFALVVMGIAMTVSGGFQMLQEEYGLMGVAGFIIVFVLVSVGFMAMVRRSLKRAMGQSDQGNSSAQHDEPM